MYTPDALLDIHTRAHTSLQKLLAHCRELSDEELNRDIAGFGYSTVRLQLHHLIAAEDYWIGVVNGVIKDDDETGYPTIASLEAYRNEVFAETENYLRSASVEELNTPRTMTTWDNRERLLIPAHVFMRTLTHLYHHQGQIVAMCRLLGKPAEGMDFPLSDV